MCVSNFAIFFWTVSMMLSSIKIQSLFFCGSKRLEECLSFFCRFLCGFFTISWLWEVGADFLKEGVRWSIYSISLVLTISGIELSDFWVEMIVDSITRAMLKGLKFSIIFVLFSTPFNYTTGSLYWKRRYWLESFLCKDLILRHFYFWGNGV